jgi:hypothetical protein
VEEYDDGQDSSAASSIEQQLPHDSYYDEKTIEAYYILEEFLLDLNNGAAPEYFQQRLSMDRLVEHYEGDERQADLFIFNDDWHQFTFEPEWFARSLGFTMTEFNIAIRELGKNYPPKNEFYQPEIVYRNGDYNDELDAGHEEYTHKIYVENVSLAHIMEIDFTQSEMDKRVSKEVWMLVNLER